MNPVRIMLNGASREVPEGVTVRALLELLGIDAARVAVERNADVVAKATYETARIVAGDTVEIVTFVGGG